MADVKKITSCHFCESKRLVKVFDLGKTPPANSFLKKKDLKKHEGDFPLQVYFCKKCSLLQLGHIVDPEILFKHYVYVSSTSPVFVKHFEDYAKSVFKKFRLNKKSLVIDIGSNDGILLKPFKSLGSQVLGVDPAENIAKVATREGIPTLPKFFDTALAQEIANKYGEAEVITANNVFAHTRDLSEIVKGVKVLLKKNGVFIFEVAYLGDFLEKNLFDTVYHEHLYYHSVAPLVKFFKSHQMKVFNVERVSTHGGSIRVYVKKNTGKHKIKDSVKGLVREEIQKGLNKEKTYKEFAKKIKANKEDLTKLLRNLKEQGKKVVGYGAPAKGNTLLNYFGINSKMLDYIVDDSPLKQGLFTPGTHIPVVSSEKLNKSPRPDYVLILAWNFAESIMDKLSEFSENGGKFIVPVPTPTVISDKRFISKSIIEEDLSAIIKGIGKDAQKLSGKTVLISGGSGFLGSYINQTINLLNQKVLTKKCKVISIDNYITGSEKRNFIGPLDDKYFQFIYQDVRLPMLIADKVDYVIHAAGLASPYYYQKYPLETIESAVVGAKNLLEIARTKNVTGFLFFSSSEIYGDPDPKHVPTPETYAGHVSSVGPRACYDESKRLGETLSLVYHQQFGVPIKIVRPFNVYGPGMRPNDYRVIPTFLHRSLTGQPLPVHGKGTQTRTFCYVTDAIIAFFKVLLSGRPGEVYNVGNDKPELTMYELAKIVVDKVGGKAEVKVVDYPSSYPAGEPQRRCPDLTKITKELNYVPQVDLESGLTRSIDWFRSEHKLYNGK